MCSTKLESSLHKGKASNPWEGENVSKQGISKCRVPWIGQGGLLEGLSDCPGGVGIGDKVREVGKNQVKGVFVRPTQTDRALL